DVFLSPAAGGQSRGGHLEQLTGLEQLLERQVVCGGEQVDARAQRLRTVPGARNGDERAAAGPLGGPDQALRGQQPQRLADRRAADTELLGQHRLLRQAGALLEPPFEDLLAQPHRDQLVRLGYAVTSRRRKPARTPHSPPPTPVPKRPAGRGLHTTRSASGPCGSPPARREASRSPPSRSPASVRRRIPLRTRPGRARSW